MLDGCIEGYRRPDLIQAIDFYIAYHADNFAVNTREKAQNKVLSDSIFIRPKLICHGFADQYGPRPACNVAFVYIAPANHGDVESAQIPWADYPHIYLGLF